MSVTSLLRSMLMGGVMIAVAACGGSAGPPSGSSPAPSTPASATTRAGAAAPTPPAGAEQATVTHVVDGDTIDVRRADGTIARVRYIGVNTPETVDPRRPVECFGKDAGRRNTELVAGKTVLLEKDVSETDRFDRLLRYIWVGDQQINALLVAEGYARVVTYPPDVRYVDWLHQLERDAREDGRGLWSGCKS
jgi:micrococcal nuclease